MLEFHLQVSSPQADVGIVLAFIPPRMTLTFTFSNDSWQSERSYWMCRQKSSPAGSRWETVEGGVDWEWRPLLQRNSKSVVALVQVFWWIRLALYRESMCSGTKKQLGAGGTGGKIGHQTPAWPLIVVWSNHQGLAWDKEILIREVWKPSLFDTFCVNANDPNPQCLFIGTSGATLHFSFHYRWLFFHSIHA